jgi:hypothetical protein
VDWSALVTEETTGVVLLGADDRRKLEKMRSVAAYIHGLMENLAGHRAMISSSGKNGRAGTIKREPSKAEASGRGRPSSLLAFGDFFVREECSHVAGGHVRADRPSKYTSYSVSEGFQRESEKVYLAKLLRSAAWKSDLRSANLIQHLSASFVLILGVVHAH